MVLHSVRSVLVLSVAMIWNFGYPDEINFKESLIGTLEFRDKLPEFHRCLCSDNKAVCQLKVSTDSDPSTVNEVSGEDMKLDTDLYEPTYECILPHKPEQTSITCFRMVKNYLSNFKQHSNSYSGSKYQNFEVKLGNSECSMSCINIVWRNGSPDEDDFTGDILRKGKDECSAQNQESSSSGLGVGLGITLPLVFILAAVVGFFLWKRKTRQPSQPEALQKSVDIQGKSRQNGDDNGLGEGRCSYVDMAAPPVRGAALAVIEESDVYEAVRPTSEFVYTSLMDSEDTQAEYGNMNEVLRENSDSEDMSATYDNFGV